MEYSREETRVTDAQAQVTAAVDRPLCHVAPWIFCDMYDVHGLAPEGFEKTDRNCVARQLELLVRRRAHGQTRPLWTRETIEE